MEIQRSKQVCQSVFSRANLGHPFPSLSRSFDGFLVWFGLGLVRVGAILLYGVGPTTDWWTGGTIAPAEYDFV